MNEETYMKIAIKEARKAFLNKEIPVGAVIVYKNKIIAKGYNKKEKTNNPLNHAEIIAIKKACNKLKDWRLNECLLFVNLEPCLMCMGAIIECRIKKVYCSVKNKQFNSSYNKMIKERKPNISYGLCEKESTLLINDFFREIRK
ncbi:MAG: nucleoside deaminase [Bacilli bacterium]|nr:nucleoside deaminase [Bacilli bacterium]